MPLYVPAKEAHAGMRLAEAFSFMGRTMLPAGRVLTKSDTTKLHKRFPDLYLRIGDPLLDEAIEFEDDSHDRTVARHVQNKIATCMSSVEERFSARTSLSATAYDEAREIVEGVTEYLADNPVTAAILDEHFDANDYLSKHSGNVFYLSSVLASAARQYVVQERAGQTVSSAVAMDMLPLGLGAMFIDLGMYPLRDLFTIQGRLSVEDRQRIRQHPITGVKMLPDSFPGTAKMVVRTHHENIDGSGYPEEIDRDKLHVFSRIVRITDAYDAATSRHVYTHAKSPAYTLWAMSTGPYKRFYDPTLMNMFATLIQPFPIGAKLRLVDGRQAVVVRYNHTNPFQPIVVIAFSADGRRLRDSQLQGPLTLDPHSGLRLDSFRGEDLSFIYEPSGTPSRAHPLFNDTGQSEPTTMFEMAFP